MRGLADAAGGHDVAAGGLPDRHQVMELAHRSNADLPRLPLVAKDQVPLTVLPQQQVAAGVMVAHADLGDFKALHAKGLAEQLLEFVPAQIVDEAGSAAEVRGQSAAPALPTS